jgi:hypothetical protein
VPLTGTVPVQIVWAESRHAFERKTADASGQEPGGRWQGRSYRGLDSRGEPAVDDHTTRLRLRAFEPKGKATDRPGRDEATEAPPAARRETGSVSDPPGYGCDPRIRTSRRPISSCSLP